MRFWRVSRDLAAVGVWVRPPTQDRPPHALLPPAFFEATAGRAYPRGANLHMYSCLPEMSVPVQPKSICAMHAILQQICDC